jgi:hypothetical protein
MTRSSQGNEPPPDPGRFTLRYTERATETKELLVCTDSLSAVPTITSDSGSQYGCAAVLSLAELPPCSEAPPRQASGG